MILYEAFFVGVAIAIIGFIISFLLMYTDKNFSVKKYTFWRSVLLSYFVTGFIGHLLFEYVGLNSYYCRNGIACKSHK